MGKVRATPPASLGCPKLPENPWPARVSTTRQGVMATSTRGTEGSAIGCAAEVPAIGCISRAWRMIDASCSEGCQYRGAAQLRTGSLWANAGEEMSKPADANTGRRVTHFCSLWANAGEEMSKPATSVSISRREWERTMDDSRSEERRVGK